MRKTRSFSPHSKQEILKMKKRDEKKIRWYHWIVWILGAIAILLLVYGIIRNLINLF